jgi:hypothetical protein
MWRVFPVDYSSLIFYIFFIANTISLYFYSKCYSKYSIDRAERAINRCILTIISIIDEIGNLLEYLQLLKGYIFSIKRDMSNLLEMLYRR